jgi:diguanylate cyclase (GGDEF)-like protein
VFEARLPRAREFARCAGCRCRVLKIHARRPNSRDRDERERFPSAVPSPTHDQLLLVDDDPGAIHLLSRILAGVASLQFATSGADALRLARESPPTLVLLDAEMPGMSGFQVCEAMKADATLRDVAVIFVSKHNEPAFEVSGFELGAADFIAKPFTPQLVLARVRAQLRVKHMADELRRIATIDGLTGVANRRLFDEVLEREWRRCRRSGDPIALLMIDVDHFKRFNDHYGHPAGDACLRSVAQALVRASLRPADLVARYGGEEFTMLLPQTPRDGALHVAQSALEAIAALGIAHEKSPTGPQVSVSVGIACYDDHSANWLTAAAGARLATDHGLAAMDLMRAADIAMYAAKHAGRARATLLDIADADMKTRGAARDSSRSPSKGVD